MSNLTGQDVSFKIDGAAGTIIEITADVNESSLSSTLETLEDSSLADDEKTFLSGLAESNFPINGFWNTTTRAIYGPLLGNRTTKLKTVEWGDGTNYYSGEAWVGGVELSGNVNTVVTFSAEHQISGALTSSTKPLS